MTGGTEDRGGKTTDELVVRFLTGEMDRDEIAAFEGRIASDPELAAEVESMARVTGRLGSLKDEAWNPPEPPALDRAVFEGSSASGGGAGDRGRGFRLPGFPAGFGWPRLLAGGLAAAALFLGGALVGTALDGEGPGPATTERLALSGIGPEAPAGAEGEVSLVSSGSDRLRLSVSGLEETGEREFYELWLLGDKGELVSLGSFRVDPGGSNEIEVPVPVDPNRYRYYDVSIEPANGSPEHSGRSVLRGLTEA